MYPLLSVFIIAIGILLFAFAKKMTKNNHAFVIFIRIIGCILIIGGLVLLYFLLSGNIKLPLFKA